MYWSKDAKYNFIDYTYKLPFTLEILVKKMLILFFVSAIYLNAGPFYQNPSPKAAYEWIQEKKIEQVPAQDRSFVLSLATTFIAQIIQLHPDYIESFITDFAHFSAQEKNVFVQAFSIFGIQDPRIKEKQLFQEMPLSRLDILEFKTGHDFDLMVVSFLATGDERFLKSTMAFLNSDPELLFFTFEWNNRRAISQLLKELTGQSELPDDGEFLDILRNWPREKQKQFALRMAAWNCLELIRKEDPTAEEKISRICKIDPVLDYRGTLEEILNYN